MVRKRVSVVRESDSGRNELFQDNSSGDVMDRQKFVARIENGDYPRYHVRIVNGIPTPASNPDDSENNNLGLAPPLYNFA